MEQPGVIVQRAAQASSMSALWSRMNARSGLPFARQAVHMKEDGYYVGDYRLTIFSTKWLMHDNVLFATFLLPAAWVWLMNRVPK
uniref:Uncharacterized protein n=1 Tax=Pfiesteria piscicida TaxID=71001 RepID=A3E3U7_PFIPI|nr:unknown [Pfiesteria piscicida]